MAWTDNRNLLVTPAQMRDIDIASYKSRAFEESFSISHAIVEARIAIARETLSMKSIKNVSFQAEYAHIKGCLDTYLVQMGTGAVYNHRMTELYVPPDINRSARRIFLPFEGCDPQTIDILSNIIFFANDKKINDINLLEQIEADKLLMPPDFIENEWLPERGG
jgi:hypothetical protein